MESYLVSPRLSYCQAGDKDCDRQMSVLDTLEHLERDLLAPLLEINATAATAVTLVL
jgi:hypothetical protein